MKHLRQKTKSKLTFQMSCPFEGPEKSGGKSVYTLIMR